MIHPPFIAYIITGEKKTQEGTAEEFSLSTFFVGQWSELFTMESAQKRYRESDEIYSEVAKELGVEVE